MELAGQIALVTGATRGIGRAIALALGKAGATVVGTATSEAGAQAIGAALSEALIRGRGAVLNVTDAAAIDRLSASPPTMQRTLHGSAGPLLPSTRATLGGEPSAATARCMASIVAQ